MKNYIFITGFLLVSSTVFSQRIASARRTLTASETVERKAADTINSKQLLQMSVRSKVPSTKGNDSLLFRETKNTSQFLRKSSRKK